MMQRAGLLDEEVLALRLYTGPLFVLYNAVLRGFPERDVEKLRGDKDAAENRYETTIFVIASGITKLAKVSDIPADRRLYRGLGGMVLPRQFWEGFEECQVTFAFQAPAADVKGMLRLLQDDSPATAPAAAAALSTRVFEVSSKYVPLAGWLSERACRVVKEPHTAAEAACMVVALPMSKSAFSDEERRSFAAAVKAVCGDIEIRDVADKPSDFRGGGAAPLPCRRECAPTPSGLAV
jgi:hypothetical protein